MVQAAASWPISRDDVLSLTRAIGLGLEVSG
jgi:hypothetical protein